MRRLFPGLVAFLVGMAVVLAGGQAAHAAPYWQVVYPDSTWHCTGNYQHTANPRVLFNACLIVNGSSMQTALVVYNGSSGPVRIYGETADNLSQAFCYESPLTNGYQRGCLGYTRTMANCRTYQGVVTLYVNGVPNSVLTPT